MPHTTGLAAPHPAAVEAGREAVAAGGNAIDAALAAAAALTVVYPHQCSLGGDLVALVRKPGVAGATAIVSVGAAARGVDVHRLMDGDRMPPQGADTVTVPGVVAGWSAVAGLGARLPLSSALRGAATLARDGFAVPAGLARALEGRREAVFADPGLSWIFTRAGKLLAEGDWLTQRELADTLDTLADDPTAMYTGRIARALVHGLATRGSSLEPEDFASHRAELTPAIEREFGSARWWVAPPPTQGVVLMGVMPTALHAGDSAEAAADLVRISLDAAATRQRVLGDPRNGPIDLDALLHPGRQDAPERAPRGGQTLGDTVAIVAADSDGTVVSIIQSVYQWFGSGILEPETGIVLHNRGAAFSVDQGHPGRVAPGARPPHTLLPLIVESDDVTYGLGCQGGSAQPWILAQVAPDLLSSSSDPTEVLSRPRWVIGARDIGHPVMTLLAEPGCEAAVSAATAFGVPVDQRDEQHDEAGHVQVVRLLASRDGHTLDAASDPRADGRAEIFTSPQSKESA